jgi:hypothetical protein
MRSSPAADKRCFGLMQSKGFHAFFNMNPNKSFAYMVHEGVDTETPSEIDAEIRTMREMNDHRPAVVVVWGGREWCQKWMVECKEATHMIFCTDAENLAALDVEIIDRDWRPGDAPIELDHYVVGSG